MPKGLPFSVDTFSPISDRKRHHFLTHAHKDHSVGISTYSSYPIYSTQITKTLILQQFPQLDSSLFVGIEVGETVVIDDLDGTFSVTAFDANHCIGAVMFLFEGNFGHLLHTGDCRLTPECLQNLPEIYIGRKGKKPKCCLDYVFLDCTFGKSFIMIPSKHSAIQQVINCIWKHPEAPVVYITCDLLAQDEILVEISRTFGSKVYVDRVNNAECYQALTLTAPEILSEDSLSRFQVFEGFVNFYERARAKLTEARANFQPEPLFIRPSAQWYVYDEDSKTGSQRKQMPAGAKKDSFGVWHVCFSSHSSKEELEWALQLLQPKRVVSTTLSCRAMELDYVKKHHTQVTSDDPMWKLMEINVEEGSSSPQVSTVSEVTATTGVSPLKTKESQLGIAEAKQLTSMNQSNRSRIELRLNLSSSNTRTPLTLFGRARLALQDSHALQEQNKVLPINIDLSSMKPDKGHEQESISQIDSYRHPNISEERESVLQGENDLEMVKSESRFYVGSSENLSESVRKLYRSMNVLVPRPLPSLVKLMNSNKRAKRSFQF
ncbi:5' exonuclease Apollo [Thalictrum thalictroides]|uniref:5' exonuclease Apollo n=1 Tax=Thalictrum thalictroides TaxID=46969 RepID=A0A7J6VRF0_THATH|nr:5' exonuclease Apollo [Thalictrum thalictroides]